MRHDQRRNRRSFALQAAVGVALLAAPLGAGCHSGASARPDGGGAGGVDGTGGAGATLAPPLPGAWAPCGTLGGNQGVRGAALSADGQVLAVVFLDRHLDVVRTRDGSTLLHLAEAFPADYQGSYMPLALSSDGALLAITEPHLTVLRVADGGTVFQRDDGMLSPHFNADATKLAGVDPMFNAIAIRLADGAVSGPYGSSASYIDQVTFSPSGDVISMDYFTHLVRDETTGTEWSMAGLDGLAGQAALSPLGRYVANVEGTGNGSRTLLYRVSDKALMWTHTDPAPGAYPSALVFSADETALVQDSASTITVLDVATGAVRGTPQGALDGSTWAAGPGAAPVVAIDSVGILAWDGGDLSHARRVNTPTADGNGTVISSAAVSSDGARAAFAGKDAVTLWDLHTRRLIWARRQGADSVAFSADGTRVLVSHGWVQELPVSGADPAPLPPAKCVSSWSARYAPGGQVAVSLPWGFLMLASAGDTSFSPILAKEQVYAGIAISPDGLSLATSEPALYRLPDMKRVWPATPPPPPPADACVLPPVSTPLEGWVAFSPDGALLVARRGIYDPLSFHTSIHRAADGMLIRDLATDIEGKPVFSPDGAWLLAGSTVVKVDGTSSPITLDAVAQPGASTFAPDGTIIAGQSSGAGLMLCPTTPGATADGGV